jgi:integrase
LITNNYKLLLKVAVFTGMREGEILGAQWDDIDWKSKQLHVRRSWKEGAFHAPKTATSIRRVDLPDFLVSELREWRLGCPKGPDDLIFPNLEGRPLSHANLLQRGFYPALRRAGLRRIRFHDLRHTFASLLIASGEDVVRVSRLLGHASPNITLNVYSHMLPKEHYGSAERLARLVLELRPVGEGTTGAFIHRLDV